ncbi:MAG: hypothetical protein K0R48_447 [Gammaproteobacteria bacterium]|jgi:aminoglycoside/choline kinase family phosphotransferase|nr:hypothetical protein [Gammaproteobacteria bacterium]
MNTSILSNDTRLEALKTWLGHCLKTTQFHITPLAGDASFRRYFRIAHNNQLWVAMDAPPALEDSHSFVNIQQHLAALSLNVPQLYHVDLALGFILMNDLGDTWLWHEALRPNSHLLYQNAINDLFILQQQKSPRALPSFDAAFMAKELSFFTQWFLQGYLRLSLSSTEQKLLDHTFLQLIHMAESQPYYFTHRDYHSRNLMVLADNKIGILDFQDAVLGPITYDLVSLLRDCYVTLNPTHLQQHLAYYFQKAVSSGLLHNHDFAQFQKWFDWMGIQRHLKAIFIFARKLLRDNNSNFLSYIPRTLNYVTTISAHSTELAAFHAFLQSRIVPTFEKVYLP